MFLQASVILSTGGVSASVHAGIPCPPQSRHPPEQTHTPRSRHPPGADTSLLPEMQPPAPGSRYPSGADTPQADSGIRSMSGRYASYWNAFLFKFFHWDRPHLCHHPQTCWKVGGWPSTEMHSSLNNFHFIPFYLMTCILTIIFVFCI